MVECQEMSHRTPITIDVEPKRASTACRRSPSPFTTAAGGVASNVAVPSIIFETSGKTRDSHQFPRDGHLFFPGPPGRLPLLDHDRGQIAAEVRHAPHAGPYHPVRPPPVSAHPDQVLGKGVVERPALGMQVTVVEEQVTQEFIGTAFLLDGGGVTTSTPLMSS